MRPSLCSGSSGAGASDFLGSRGGDGLLLRSRSRRQGLSSLDPERLLESHCNSEAGDSDFVASRAPPLSVALAAGVGSWEFPISSPEGLLHSSFQSPPHFPQLQLWSETPSSILFLHFSLQLWSELLHHLGLLQLWSELLRQQLALALPARGFSCELERRQRLALALPARGFWRVLLALPAPGFWRVFLACTMGHDMYAA